MDYYNEELEEQMLYVYLSLNEKDRRHYAAIESIKLGYGGTTYISEIFSCNRNTISDGIKEIKNNTFLPENEVRSEGAGRIATEKKIPNINEIFLKVIEEHIAGDPMDKEIRWVKISRAKIRKAMKKYGIEVSRNIIKKLLKKNKFVKRKIQRKRKTGKSADREQQFQIIAKQRKKFEKSNNPIISFDTKKKETLGELHRDGRVDCTKAPESYDHDYAYLSTGKMVPHGIYETKRNKAYVTIGTSNETAEFICDAIKKWWNTYGKKAYPDATEILAFCDAGGANSYRHHVFKFELQKLVNSINIPIRICHYPPYSSKWNPIEHRVFPHVTRAMEGQMIHTVEQAKEMIGNAETKTGLEVTATIIKKFYEKGEKISKDIIEKLRIKKDKNLGHLNYRILPQEA